MLEDALNAFGGTIVLITHDRYLIRSVANAIVEVDGGQATMYPGDFEYYAAKRGVDIETRGAVEGARPTPRGTVAASPKPRESAKAAAARRRQEAEARNARSGRTRELRAALERARADATAARNEVAEAGDRLADPATYADPALVRDLVARHNAALDRIPVLEADEQRLAAELEAADEALARA